MKPRSRFAASSATPTAVPGTRLWSTCHAWPRSANLYTVVRNVAHDDLYDGSATYLALTGHFHARKSANPPPHLSDQPTYSALLHRVRPSPLHPYTAVHVNGPLGAGSSARSASSPASAAVWSCSPLGDVTQNSSPAASIGAGVAGAVHSMRGVRCCSRWTAINSTIGRDRARLTWYKPSPRGRTSCSGRGIFGGRFDARRSRRRS